MIFGDNIEDQLAPFDENLEMPRYVSYTKDQLIAKGRKEIEDYKNGTYARYLQDPEEYAKDCRNENHLNYLKNEFPLRLNWTDEEIYQEEIKWYEDEPERITPEGGIYSTRNPQSKWDWYEVGGRWAGSIKLKDDVETSETPNFSGGWPEEEMRKAIEEKRVDSAVKHEIANLDSLTTFAVIKDGKWYARGEMGWWGAVSNPKEGDEWEKQIKQLLSEIPDETLITIVDCHI